MKPEDINIEEIIKQNQEDEERNKTRNAKSATINYYPRPITLDEFCDEIKKGIEGFRKNMNNLENFKNAEKNAEDWFMIFGAWSEMEHKDYSKFNSKD